MLKEHCLNNIVPVYDEKASHRNRVSVCDHGDTENSGFWELRLSCWLVELTLFP